MFTCFYYGKDVKLWSPWIWVYSKFLKANPCMSYTWHGFVVFVISLSIKVYVIINVDFSYTVNMCLLSFTSQECSQVMIIPHYCYLFKHYRNTEISCKLGHNHWTFEAELSDGPPFKQVKLQPKHATDKMYTDFGYALSCACIPLTSITSFLLYTEILQKYRTHSFDYFLWFFIYWSLLFWEESVA
jgi:hypothetical protein